MADWNGFKKNGTIYTPNDSTARGWIGTLSNLATTVKTSIVAAINELVTAIANRVDWESYAKTGVHNILPMTLDNIKAINTDGTWSGNAYTRANVTYTILTDSNGNVTGITTSGKANARGWLFLAKDVDFGNGDAQFYDDHLEGDYIFTDGVHSGEDADNDKYVIYTAQNHWVYLLVADGVDASGITWYPMVRYKEDPNPTFGPYAMTNEELTDAVAYSTSAFTDIVSGATADQNSLLKVGRIVVARIFLTGVTANAWTALANIPEGYRPVSFVRSINLSKNTTYLEANSGIIQCSGALSNENAQAYMTWITA